MSTTISPPFLHQTAGPKTICFSCPVEIHEKVIGSFIEKNIFC
ncbi:hypothetical protein BIQ91_14850 [Escherichia coli]|nr:hypothetical protein BIQ90_13330 [Escherichia coli]ORS52830.1 hypothetical protein BIQ91_14850 [Escherichia coli]